MTTLVFDEVDTGRGPGPGGAEGRPEDGGRGAAQTGARVTHLPQIAAWPDVHFSVEKGERDGRTYTQVERLTQQRRKEELARLTGGAVISDAILKSAGELLAGSGRLQTKSEKRQKIQLTNSENWVRISRK